VLTLFAVLAELALKTPEAKASGKGGGEQVTVFSNPAPIAPADRASNNAGTNPGIPPSNYPSPISVSGLTGTVSKVTVTFAITSTFPDDFDILLVGPTGARSLVISDAGGSGDHTNITYTFDQTAATAFPDGGTTVIPAGTYRPANYLGLATPEPGGQDNFPAPGPGLMSYTADFNVFNGTAPNGTWNLFVVDDQVIDTMSLPSGWSIDITTAGGGGGSDAAVDFNGDGRSDYVVVRNTGGGSGGQVTWYLNYSSGGATQAFAWGLASDFFFAEDFDGDLKDDISVWRPGPATVASFYILNSNGFTLRVEAFGQTGDDPTVVGDYNNDGKADLAVYRAGVSAGQPSTWYYRTVAQGPVAVVQWGLNGDSPAPGDYDGNGSNDFCVQRNSGGGGEFWLALNGPGTVSVTPFGVASDIVVPGDYDGDAKTDLAVARSSGGSIIWYWRPSGGGGDQAVGFGAAATDFPTQGDYDGDGKTDQAVWRNDGTFWVRNIVSGAVNAFQLGAAGDYPVANFNSH
jgi:subtilisin-like proprotein convertase family protein